jgi:hypothetical protein
MKNHISQTTIPIMEELCQSWPRKFPNQACGQGSLCNMLPLTKYSIK